MRAAAPRRRRDEAADHSAVIHLLWPNANARQPSPLQPVRHLGVRTRLSAATAPIFFRTVACRTGAPHAGRGMLCESPPCQWRWRFHQPPFSCLHVHAFQYVADAFAYTLAGPQEERLPLRAPCLDLVWFSAPWDSARVNILDRHLYTRRTSSPLARAAISVPVARGHAALSVASLSPFPASSRAEQPVVDAQVAHRVER